MKDRCCVCGAKISVEYKYKLNEGLVACVTHDDSQAGEPQTKDGCLRPADKEQENG